MVVEILGAKMLSPYVGTSHFVWTAQIAVTLVALSVGYGVGGWLVDRSPRLSWIYGAILAAAVYLCGTVLGCEPIAFFCLRFNLAAGSLLASALLFFVPLALLAMVGPFFVRMLTMSVESVGANMGRLTAISTLGSVAGTILIGYVLIPHCSNSLTMYLTAGALMLVAVGYFLGWARRLCPPAIAGAVLGAFVGFVGIARQTLTEPDQAIELARRNSNFGLMQVIEPKGGGRRYYLNDLLTQNTYDPAARASGSLFTYMLYGLAHAYRAEVKDVLCIGLGVGIVPMQFAREGVRVDAVEINPAVVPIATQYFDFEPRLLNLVIGDGRYYLNACSKQYDVIVLDAFLGESPPSHLMTREALGALQRRLKPGGTVVMNTFGEFEAGRDFFCASLDRTLRTVFRSVKIHAAGNGNVFFVASDQPELSVLHAMNFETIPFSVRGLAEAAFTSKVATEPEHGRVLTDDFNPVDYYDAANRESLRQRLAASYRP